MAKIDLNYANYKIYGQKSQQSNKNLLADLLNEVADAIGFDMKYLRENHSIARGYAIEEKDLTLLQEIAEKAKSSEGKRIRCKDFSENNIELLSFFQQSFIDLASDNGMTHDEFFEQSFRMYARTDFATMKYELATLSEEFKNDLERFFFAPNDFLEDEEDEFTSEDKFMFLSFVAQNMDEISEHEIRGVYWCFREDRDSFNNKKMIDFLHSMNEEEKRDYLKKAMHQAKFELKLDDDPEYGEVLREWAKIESGEGKLQDRKKVKGLALKLAEVMDRNADGYFTLEEYAFGEPDFKRSASKEDTELRKRLSESQQLLNGAIRYYAEFRDFRRQFPFSTDDERLIEITYRQRFGENFI